MSVEFLKYKDYVMTVQQIGPHRGVVIKPTWYPQVVTKVDAAETRAAAITAAKAIVDQSPRRPR